MTDKAKKPATGTAPPPVKKVRNEAEQGAGNARTVRALKPKQATLDGQKEHDG